MRTLSEVIPTIESADIKRCKRIPDWVQRAFDAKLAAARAIACPLKRRVAEIEIDLEFDRIKDELREAQR